MGSRTAFVTSGANGLGLATVRALVDAGWNVFFTYRTSERSARALTEYALEHGQRAACIEADLLDQTQVRRAAATCLEQMQGVDGLIHNFGPFVFERRSLAEYSDELWKRMLDGNLNTFFHLYKAFVPGMRERGFGRVITLGFDGAGEAAGWRYRSAYAAAKSALASLTRSVAREERQNGITANMVCPGDIRGPLKERRIGEVYRPEDHLGRPPVGEDVARMITFLCDEHSQQVNGTVVEVTGGYDVRAYDDGKDVVAETAVYAVGDTVRVHPWGRTGHVIAVQSMHNRNVVYEVESGDWKGSFTAYQLDSPDGD